MKFDVSMFLPAMKVSYLRHMCVLGAPIDDNLYCTGFFATLNLKMLLLLTHRWLLIFCTYVTSWISVLSSEVPGLHFDPSENSYYVVVGLGHLKDLMQSTIALDLLGHHEVSCRYGGDVVLHHNQL